MVPFISEINDELDLDKAAMNETGYDETDFDRFEAAFGIDLTEVLPEKHLDALEEDNMFAIMDANNVDAKFDVTQMLFG